MGIKYDKENRCLKNQQQNNRKKYKKRNQNKNQQRMSMSQSKLVLQLQKQQRIQEKVLFSEQKIEDLYMTISKIEPKNLMLVEFLTLMIEKNLIKNSRKIETFVEMFEQIKGKKLQQEHNSFTTMNNNISGNATNYSNSSNLSNTNNNSVGNNQLIQKQQQKFNKKKFLKLLKDVAKMLYPGDQKAYESTLYMKLIMPQQQENRMKVDENLKKFLNEQVILHLAKYTKQFQTIFQVYMPENYNQKLGFSWNQIRLLEKKLPMTCLLRILYQTQICPQLLSPIQILQILSKMVPSLNTNHKEGMFYYSETFNSYMRDHVFNDEIKLLEGDIGLTFLEFIMVLARIATEIAKDGKQEITKVVDKMMLQVGATDILKHKKQPLRMNKLQNFLFNHFKNLEKNAVTSLTTSKYIKKKTAFKKQNHQLNDLLDDSDDQSKRPKKTQAQLHLKKLQHQSMLITKDDLLKMKRNLDDELGPVPEKVHVDKENQGYFNVNQKFTVIGDQLPKLQQKNKPAAKPNPKDKKQDPLLGFKPQDEPKLQPLNKQSLMLNRKKKLRLNSQHPVILSQVFYPTSFSDPNIIPLKQQQEIFLQTTYIHLGQRMYEEAYLNFQKAKRIMKAKKVGNYHSSIADKKASLMLQFYYEILEAQIFEAAGKDEAAMVHYYNAREISFNFQASQLKAKAYTYIGLSSTFYHLQDFEFSLRCLLKAKQIYGQNLQLQSIENAILLNNIASCYMMMNRNQEAVRYFNLSHQIFDLKVGRFDERTLVVQQNISKNKKAFIQQMPSFKTMWKTYVQKNTAVTGVKPAKKAAK